MIWLDDEQWWFITLPLRKQQTKQTVAADGFTAFVLQTILFII